MRQRLNRVRYLASFLGARGAVWRIGKKALSPIYYSEVVYVGNRYLVRVPDDRESGPGAVNSEVVDTVEALVARRSRMHPDIDFDYLVRFMQEGSDKAWVSLQSIEGDDGELTYVGFATADTGEFRMPEYRFGGPLAEHVNIGYEWEVVPEYRGSGMSARGRYATWEYRRQHGQWVATGVIRSHNTPSLRFNRRQNETTFNMTVGSFRLTRWFGGRWVQAPPWPEVRAMMEHVPEDYAPPPVGPTDC
ncbi:MAG: hypothetical protein R3C39_00095 [Dehalococcoidia bacterium]